LRFDEACPNSPTPIRTARGTSARCHLNSYSREHRRYQIAPLHINTIISPIPIRMFMPAIATPRQRSALMLSDWNLVCLPRTAFSPRDCSTPNDSHGNPAIVPTAVLKNDLRSRRAANRRLVLIGEIIESKIDITDDCGVARKIHKCWHYGRHAVTRWAANSVTVSSQNSRNSSGLALSTVGKPCAPIIIVGMRHRRG
jgi:hypothetical protein